MLAKEGVIVTENDFLNRLKLFAKRPPVSPVTNEHCNAADLVFYSARLQESCATLTFGSWCSFKDIPVSFD